MDRQYHIDDEACFSGLDAAALERRCQRVGDVGELDQIALGQCRVGGDHSSTAPQELAWAEDLLRGSQRGQQRLDRREARVGCLDLGDEVSVEFVAREEDFPLVGKVAIEGALLQAGGACDLRDGGALEPLRLEQLERRAFEPVSCASDSHRGMRTAYDNRSCHQLVRSMTTDAVIT